jgi:hypothetical protein
MSIVVSVLIALGVFYLAFFQIAPWMVHLLPPGPWHGILTIGVYILIAYLGGIGLPIVIIWIGFMVYSRKI